MISISPRAAARRKRLLPAACAVRKREIMSHYDRGSRAYATEQRLVMLHRENGRRNKHRYLLAAHDTALNAARSATSVFPKPTSPQSSLSIGNAVDSMSFLISVIGCELSVGLLVLK